MTAHLESHAIQPLPMRQIRRANTRAARPRVRAVNQHRDQHQTTAFGEAARELRWRLHAGREACDRFRLRSGVGDGNYARYGRAVRLEEEALGLHAVEYGPTHRVNLVTFAAANDG